MRPKSGEANLKCAATPKEGEGRGWCESSEGRAPGLRKDKQCASRSYVHQERAGAPVGNPAQYGAAHLGGLRRRKVEAASEQYLAVER